MGGGKGEPPWWGQRVRLFGLKVAGRRGRGRWAMDWHPTQRWTVDRESESEGRVALPPHASPAFSAAWQTKHTSSHLAWSH